MIKHRITIYNPDESNDGIIKDLTKSSVKLEPLSAFQREDRITIDDFKQFDHIEKLRIQLIKGYDNSGFFGYQYQRGLSIYAKPKILSDEADKESFYEELNSIVKDLFDVDLTPQAWIISYDSLFYHSDTAKTTRLAEFIASHSKIDIEKDIQAFDIVIDGAQAVFKSTNEVRSPITFSERNGISREIGLFAREEGISTDDDVVLTGIRIVLGQDEEEEEIEAADVDLEVEVRNAHKTLFHVKPRHRHHSFTTKSRIKENGLHPILVNEIDQKTNEPSDEDVSECGLFYYLNLEKSIFFDKYQTDDTNRLLAYYGSSNLELPEYSMEGWGNELLIQLLEKKDTELLLHSRYQKPDAESNETSVQIAHPMIFYACDVQDSHLLSSSPFDNKRDIGGSYERFFTDNTVFYHLHDRASDSDLTVKIPNGNASVDLIVSYTMYALGLGLLVIFFAFACAFKVKRKIVKQKVE